MPVTSGPSPVLPCHIGRRQSESADATPGAQTWISGHQRQNPFQAINRHRARMSECATNVLMMDGPINEGDHAAEAGGQALRTQMPTQEVL